MDFSLSEEQEIYRTSLRRFLDQNYSFEKRRQIARGETGMSEDIWRGLADLGALALPIPAEFGGLDGSPVDTMVTLRELGRALVIEPFVETVVVGSWCLTAGASQSLKEKWLPELAAGTLRLALAYTEPQSRYRSFDVSTTAARADNTFTLSGRKIISVGLPWADKVIVSARTSGGQFDTDGISLFLVDKNLPGLTIRTYPTVDGRQAGDIELDQVEVDAAMLIGEPGEGWPLLEEALDHARTALCAEALGAMEVLNETTLEYARTRRQFENPIGSFQVIQHRLADMMIAYEEALSVTLMATLRLDQPESRSRSTSIAKAKVGEVARKIGKEAVQIHGGIGMTDELDVGHYFKRLTMIDMALGDSDYHIDRLAGLER